MSDNWWTKLTELHEEAKREHYAARGTERAMAVPEGRFAALTLARETLAPYAKRDGHLR